MIHPIHIYLFYLHCYNVSSRLLVSIDPFGIDTNAAGTTDDGDHATVYITNSVFTMITMLYSSCSIMKNPFSSTVHGLGRDS